ncbi:phosphotransferase [Streptomyces sp. NPDC096339]|uniref:phosphotransferase n=1 Tax=Streptomyces sp. NPDC096339 TaxID=3366086 RepID=UPI003808E7AA
MDVSLMIEWAQKMYPHPGGAWIPYLRRDQQLNTPAQAAAQVALAYRYHRNGKLMPSGILDFGFGLSTLATTLMGEGRNQEAAATFQVALQTFAPLFAAGRNVGGVMERCRASLNILEVAESDELPPFFDSPIMSLSSLLQEAEPTEGQLFASLASGSGESVDSAGMGDALSKYLEELTEHSHLARRSFGKMWSEDMAAACDRLPDRLPSDQRALVDQARWVRRSVSRDAEPRVVILLTALVNHHLWTKQDGLRSNKPQLHVDLMRYTSAAFNEGVQKCSRDLILGSVEAQIAVAHGMPAMALQEIQQQEDLLCEAVGTYLLLTGPSPAMAHEMAYDERVYFPQSVAEADNHQGDAFGRKVPRQPVPKPLWATHLLRQWRSSRDIKEASFALASAAGWDRLRAGWLLGQLFAAPRDPASQQQLLAWQNAVDAFMAAAERVTVEDNPWKPEPSDYTQSSTITSDKTGRLQIPDPVLKAVVAQGLETDDFIKVRGDRFDGRRMPTYLLSNKYRPISILKVDHADRVAREVTNFEKYAEKRLHDKYRPSRCQAHDMEMYLGEGGEPLRAIVTSYAFEEGEQPSTLRTWFHGAQAQDPAVVIEQLLLTTMRPWIADVRRDRVDLRAEYPVFRPYAAPDKQSPTSSAAGELAKLTDSAVSEGLGLSLPKIKDRPADSLRGCLGLEQAIGQMNSLEWVNPLWFAAAVAELDGLEPSDRLDNLIDPKRVDLRAYDALLVLSHGDLHMDNVLCTSASSALPQPFLIDFETAHYGHVCKDLARLEACILTHVYEWDAAQAGRIAAYVATGTRLVPPPLKAALPHLSAKEERVLTAVRRIRKVAFGCGQGHWPIPMHEYQLALAGALIPMIRSAAQREQRQFALTLSTVVCSALLDGWRHASTPEETCRGTRPTS